MAISRKDISVGCERHSLDWWLKHFPAKGSEHGYTEAQIAEYGEHLRYASQWIERMEALLPAPATAETATA